MKETSSVVITVSRGRSAKHFQTNFDSMPHVQSYYTRSMTVSIASKTSGGTRPFFKGALRAVEQRESVNCSNKHYISHHQVVDTGRFQLNFCFYKCNLLHNLRIIVLYSWDRLIEEIK